MYVCVYVCVASKSETMHGTFSKVLCKRYLEYLVALISVTLNTRNFLPCTGIYVNHAA